MSQVARLDFSKVFYIKTEGPENFLLVKLPDLALILNYPLYYLPMESFSVFANKISNKFLNPVAGLNY